MKIVIDLRDMRTASSRLAPVNGDCYVRMYSVNGSHVDLYCGSRSAASALASALNEAISESKP